jgi:UDP-3-O-[3-hydroxymyristoyl] N-acetylglucosamine deacetylase
MRICTAPANYGVWFKRVDVTEGDAMIPARFDAVCDTRLCTVLGNADGATVSTVEHVMSALSACGVDNALIEIDGPEVPIMDGSAEHFVRGLAKTGLLSLNEERVMIRVLETVVVDGEGGARAELHPSDEFVVDFEIDFQDPAIGRQHRVFKVASEGFVDDIADCRTFGHLADVERLRAAGLGRGGSLDNAVVVDNGRVLNPGGLRHPDEFVRHKILDAIGDLALAGSPVMGRYVGVKAGHGMTNRLLRALMARPSAWRFESAEMPVTPLVARDRRRDYETRVA